MDIYFRRVQHQPYYRPKDTYFIELLKKESDHIEETIKTLEKELENLKKYQQQVTQRAAEILTFEYEYFINISKYKKDRIEYEVRVIKIVKGQEHRYYWNNNKANSIEYAHFWGTERKEALNQAQEWANKYNTKIIKKNF